MFQPFLKLVLAFQPSHPQLPYLLHQNDLPILLHLDVGLFLALLYLAVLQHPSLKLQLLP
uniref:Uncharacterized protein n=1 Tax=Arundo donax TaxID=35708 RepID=A0A0A9GFU9_ARUDO